MNETNNEVSINMNLSNLDVNDVNVEQLPQSPGGSSPNGSNNNNNENRKFYWCIKIYINICVYILVYLIELYFYNLKFNIFLKGR